MSSDEEFDYGDEEDDQIFIDDDDDDMQPAPQQAAQAQAPYYQAQPLPLPNARVPQVPQQYINPGAFQAGFGGHAFARPPASAFRRQYRAYSTAILEVQQGRSYGGGRANLMYGGKIVMPPSALDELTQLDIEFPVTFEITNPALPDLNTHVGVLEFIAEEGTVNLPQWVMDQLRLNEGDPIRIWGGRYPKGKMIKIQAQSADFIEVSDPKAVLEQALRNFSVLSAGDIIEINYQTLVFRLLIMEITPPGPAISVIDTDVEVDFAAPLGYVEPDYGKLARDSKAPTMKDKFVIDTGRTEDVDARGSGTSTPVPGSSKGGSAAALGPWEAFKGSGVSLAGKRIRGRGVSAKKIEAVDEDSKIIRSDQVRIITADTQIGGRQVPARLDLPFGNLFFGFDNLRPPPGSAAALAEEAAASATPNAIPFASVGNGNTLSGRQRVTANTPAGAPATTPAIPRAQVTEEVKPKVPFSGQGQSLGGKKKIETIEIDSD
ncbi:ubiquitin fusion degradation protein 1, partial [Phenoliferia sp. Uapishka_3]